MVVWLWNITCMAVSQSIMEIEDFIVFSSETIWFRVSPILTWTTLYYFTISSILIVAAFPIFAGQSAGGIDWSGFHPHVCVYIYIYYSIVFNDIYIYLFIYLFIYIYIYLYRFIIIVIYIYTHLYIHTHSIMKKTNQSSTSSNKSQWCLVSLPHRGLSVSVCLCVSGWTTCTRWQSTIPGDGRTGICLCHGGDGVPGPGKSMDPGGRITWYYLCDIFIPLTGWTESLWGVLKASDLWVGCCDVVPTSWQSKCVGTTRLGHKVLDWSVISPSSWQFYPSLSRENTWVRMVRGILGRKDFFGA